MTRTSWKSKLLSGLKKAVIGIAVFGFIGWLIWVSTIKAAEVKERELSEGDDFERTEITKPIAYGYREGALLWRLTGLKAVEVKETQRSTVDRIYQMTFYKEGEPNLYASGDSGYWDKSREKLILRGNVHCVSADGTTILVTEEMIWYEKTENIKCPKPIDLWVEENHITSDALFSDKDLVVLDFVGNVKMFVVGLEGESFVTKEEVFPIETVEERKKAKKGLTVECEYLFYNKETKYIRCYPNVPKTVISKYQLSTSSQVPQYELILDPETGRFQWTQITGKTDEEFQESSFEYSGTSKIESFEVEEIGESLGWNQQSDESSGLPEIPGSADGSDTETTSGKVSEDGQMLISSPEEYVPGRIFSHQENKKKKIWCDFMEIFLDEKKIKARGDVRFEAVDLKDEERPPRGKVGKAIQSSYTWVDANYMNYFWDDEIVDAWGEVHGWQNEKDFEGRNLTYSDILGIMVIYGDVIVKQIGGEWLEEHEILEDIKDEDAREDAQKPTLIYSNSALSYTESDWSFGWGDVLFQQREQKIRGKRVEYDDSTEIMIMYEEVQFKNEDGEWMLADKLTMDLYLENYIVEGAQSKARVLIPEEYRDDLDEWEKEREGIVEEEEPGEEAPHEDEEPKQEEGELKQGEGENEEPEDEQPEDGEQQPESENEKAEKESI